MGKFIGMTPLQRQALAGAIDAQLPQTQCTRCGYADCLHYAQAVAEGTVAINRCQPGGAEGVERLARVTGQAVEPLAVKEVGHEAPRMLAVIDEHWCIGCTKCIQACPVDAIMGASKRMHTVLEGSCTGCELCLPICPVDCIELVPSSAQTPAPTGWAAWSTQQAQTARKRYAIHQLRLERWQHDNKTLLFPEGQNQPAHMGTSHAVASEMVDLHTQERKKKLINELLAKARKQQPR